MGHETETRVTLNSQIFVTQSELDLEGRFHASSVEHMNSAAQDALAARFRHFAEQECQDSSPLYAVLALIWPEHTERRSRLWHAIEIVRRIKPQLRQGDAVELLPGLFGAVPNGVLPCIYHTHVANQMTDGQRAKLLQTIEEAGQGRDLCHVHNNIEPHLHLTCFDRGLRHDLPLAHVDGHARWVEWLAG